MPADAATLDIILGTPAYYKLFYAFATSSLSQESLDFLAAAGAYRSFADLHDGMVFCETEYLKVRSITAQRLRISLLTPLSLQQDSVPVTGMPCLPSEARCRLLDAAR